MKIKSIFLLVMLLFLAGCNCNGINISVKKREHMKPPQTTEDSETSDESDIEMEESQYIEITDSEETVSNEYSNSEEVPNIDLPIQTQDERTSVEDEEITSTTEDPFLYEGEHYMFPDE